MWWDKFQLVAICNLSARCHQISQILNRLLDLFSLYYSAIGVLWVIIMQDVIQIIIYFQDFSIKALIRFIQSTISMYG